MTGRPAAPLVVGLGTECCGRERSDRRRHTRGSGQARSPGRRYGAYRGYRAVVGVSAGRRRYEHVGVRDDPHVAARDGRGHVRRGRGRHGDDGARGLDARLCSPDVLHVVDHDGGDDAAQRGADDPLVRDGQSQAARNRPSLCRDEHIRGRLSRRVGWLRPGRGVPAVGVRADRYPFTHARRDQRDLRRGSAAHRGRLPTDPDEACLSSPVPRAACIPDHPLAAGRPWRDRYGPGARRFLRRLLLVPDGAPLFSAA